MTKEQRQPEILLRLKDLYHRLRFENLDLLGEVYSDDIVFIDPFHRLEGLSALTGHFAKLYRHLNEIHFVYSDQAWTTGSALLTWQMEISHRSLQRGKPISVRGATQVQFEEKIHLHRDFFDGADLVYNHIPVVGTILQSIRNRVSR